MLSLIPLPYRLLALGIALLALFGSGYYYGHRAGKAAGEADLAHFRASVETQAAAAAAHTQQVIAQQEKINADTSSDYEKKLAALRSRLGPAGVHVDVRPDGSTIAALSCSTGGTDGPAANPVSAVPKSDFDQLAELSAETTQQLVSLQSWVREQQATLP